MVEPIETKKQMYAALAAGAFGNTIPQYFDVGVWEKSPDHDKYDLWGIRVSSGGGDPRMRLNWPREDVARYVRDSDLAGNVNISPMIDKHAVLRAEVTEITFGDRIGLYAWYVPPGSPVPHNDPWRGGFRLFGREAFGSAVRVILEHHLWPEDYNNVRRLLRDYPEHVVEFSACDRAVGVMPMRNTIIWEVRRY
jgi:hypothetical protein